MFTVGNPSMCGEDHIIIDTSTIKTVDNTIRSSAAQR